MKKSLHKILILCFFVSNFPFCAAIVKGLKIKPERAKNYKYVVSIQEKCIQPVGHRPKYIHLCGGTLINEYWVLTAAHCVYNRDPVNLYIQIGITVSESWNPSREKVQRIKLYRFNEFTMKNDIALIKISPHQNKTLNYTGTFSNKIKLNNFLNKQMTCNIMGFGALKYGGDYQNHLYKATVKLITNEECISILGRIMAPKFEDNTICAVGLDGEDVCQGDSGGPLICYYKGNKYLYGIVSNGLSCGERGIPSIYTLVGKYEHWINEIIN